MTDCLVDRVDDGLTIGTYFVDVFVKIQNPSQRLLRRGNVVALRAKNDDGRANVPQIDGSAIGAANIRGRQIIADKQFIDDELDLLGVEIDMTAPPALETEITGRFGVDF